MISGPLWPDDVPERFRCDTPRNLQERLAYFEFWLDRARKKTPSPALDTAPYSLTVWYNQQRRHIRALEKRLAETKEKLANLHECLCCGIVLTVSQEIGPECAKHRDKFPCNRHRRKSR